MNVALVLKFLPQYLLAAAGQGPELAAIPVVQDATDDSYLWAQGAASGLGFDRFPRPEPGVRPLRAPSERRRVRRPDEVVRGELVTTAPPTPEQQKDLDYLRSLGQLFTQVVYAQLVCEGAALALDAGGTRAGTVADLSELDEAHVDRIFAVFVQDASEWALELAGRASTTPEQRDAALRVIAAPEIDAAAEAEFVAEVLSYDGA